MKLHYSQTITGIIIAMSFVSVPYEITLLSNNRVPLLREVKVSVPYEITLLSNCAIVLAFAVAVSVPYEITLLSNTKALQD